MEKKKKTKTNLKLNPYICSVGQRQGEHLKTLWRFLGTQWRCVVPHLWAMAMQGACPSRAVGSGSCQVTAACWYVGLVKAGAARPDPDLCLRLKLKTAPAQLEEPLQMGRWPLLMAHPFLEHAAFPCLVQIAGQLWQRWY